MALLTWFAMGLAIWHFTVFVPDRFWGGIVGAFLGAVAGGMISGAIIHATQGRTLGDTDLGTALIAIPGVMLGLALVYALGARREASARL
jgi:hypothetical protein